VSSSRCREGTRPSAAKAVVLDETPYWSVAALRHPKHSSYAGAVLFVGGQAKEFAQAAAPGGNGLTEVGGLGRLFGLH